MLRFFTLIVSLLFCLPLCSNYVELQNGDKLHFLDILLQKQEFTLHSESFESLSFKNELLRDLELSEPFYIVLDSSSALYGKLRKENNTFYIYPEGLAPVELKSISNILLISKSQNYHQLNTLESHYKIGGNLGKKFGNAKNLDSQIKFSGELNFFELEQLKHRFSADAEFSFKQDPLKTDSEGNNIDREGLLDLKFKKRVLTKSFAFIGEKVSFNTSKGVKFASQLSVGLSYPFIELSSTFAEASLGISRRDTFYDQADNKGDFDLVIGGELSHKILPALTIKGSSFYYPRLNKISDYISQSTISLLWEINKPYFIELKATSDYDSTPELGKKKADSVTSITFWYEL